ncbi:MAG: YncE family protein [Steroidobacteraceae bacterium]|jgi:DNA-binding beta-propeller fold protein YncE
MINKSTVAVIGLVLLKASCALAADTPPDAAATAAPLYRTAQSIPLGAPDRWDYLTWDASSHRVFAAHQATVTVVDADRSTIAGQIPVAGANGIAIAADLHKGYAGSSEAHVIVVFDPESLHVLKQIPADEDTDGVVYDPYTERVFVMHGDPKLVTAVDTRSDTVAARIELGGKPEFAAADGAGKLYVNIVDRGEVQRIDTRSLKVDATWPLPGCERPHGIALDASAGRLFSGCVNQRLMVLDTHDGHVVAQLPIGSGSDALGFDPKRRWVLSSNGAGTLSVIRETSPDRYVPMPDVSTQITARTMTIDPDTGTVFLVAGERFEKNPAATDPHKRYGIRPGSVRMLVEQPSDNVGAPPAGNR